MNQNDDHLSNEVSVEGRITETGLTAKTKSRAVSAIDRLVGACLDIPASKMEAYVNRIRSQSRLEANIMEKTAERMATIIGNDVDAAKIVDELATSKIRALVNKTHIAEKTVDHLASVDPEDSSSDPASNPEEIDPDWLNFFANYAEKASSEAVRDLWARVLAGEIRYPKSFSLMTLRVLAELDQRTASWFQEEAEFRFMGKYILRPNDFTGERLIRLDFLEQVGLLHHIAPIGGICHVFKPDQNGFATLIESNLCLRIFTEHEVRLPVIGLTQVGKEIATILPPVDSKPVLKRVAVALRPIKSNQWTSVEYSTKSGIM